LYQKIKFFSKKSKKSVTITRQKGPDCRQDRGWEKIIRGPEGEKTGLRKKFDKGL
jgi:hypothetical protein